MEEFGLYALESAILKVCLRVVLPFEVLRYISLRLASCVEVCAS